MNKETIKDVKAPQKVFVNLRAWGWNYYNNIGLPDADATNYVVECVYTGFYNSRRLKIDIYSKLFNETYVWRNSDVKCYGLAFEKKDEWILVNDSLYRAYPRILGE